MAQWCRVGFYKEHSNDILVRMLSNYFLYFNFFYLLRIVLGSLLSIKCFTYYLFHILILYFVFLFLKQMFKSTCINCIALRFKMHIFCILCFLKKYISTNYFFLQYAQKFA